MAYHPPTAPEDGGPEFFIAFLFVVWFLSVVLMGVTNGAV